MWAAHPSTWVSGSSAGLVTVVGLAVFASEHFEDRQENPENETQTTLGAGIAILGLGTIAYGVAADVWTAPRAARDFNQRQLQVTPLVAPGTAGLSLAGTWSTSGRRAPPCPARRTATGVSPSGRF